MMTAEIRFGGDVALSFQTEESGGFGVLAPGIDGIDIT